MPPSTTSSRSGSTTASTSPARRSPCDGSSALPPPSDATPSHHLFTIVLDEGDDRDGLRSMLAERGIQTSVHYPPVHRFSLYSGAEPRLPVTDAYGARAVTLPMFAHMSDEQQDLVLDAVASCVRA